MLQPDGLVPSSVCQHCGQGRLHGTEEAGEESHYPKHAAAATAAVVVVVVVVGVVAAGWTGL